MFLFKLSRTFVTFEYQFSIWSMKALEMNVQVALCFVKFVTQGTGINFTFKMGCFVRVSLTDFDLLVADITLILGILTL